MKSQMSEETDEENCDDPIKLFDSDINAVYFGSQPHEQSTRDTVSRWKFEKIVNDEFCQLSENSAHRRSDELIQILQSGITSECDIYPLCVKLVDCKKFPWYFRKYTQQILNETNEKNDSEHEIDVIGIEEDLNDCFIIEDLQDVTHEIINNQNKENTVKSNQANPQNKTNTDIRRCREDNELQIALRLKNVVKVDFKRNQGLVGMKIVQKITNATLNVKTDRTNEVKKAKANHKDMIADENYISAADKILSHVGTQLITIQEQKESNCIGQFKISNKNQDLVTEKATSIKSTSSQKVPVQFNISKISEKLIDNLKSKKMYDLSSEAKLKVSNESPSKYPENKLNIVHEKELSSKETLTVKSTNSSNKVTSHVKDVKKTNKYKNDQKKLQKAKACHSSLIGLLVTKQNKEDFQKLKYTKQKKRKDGTQSKVTKLGKKPRKKAEKQKQEPKSPILHCSTILKKPKHEVLPKCNRPDTHSNLLKESAYLHKTVNKLTNLNNCNIMHDFDRAKNVIPKNVKDSKPSNVYTNQALQKESCTIQDKTVSQVSDIDVKSSNVPDKHVKKCNDVNKTNFKANNTQTIFLSYNKTLNEQNLLHNTHQDNMNKHSINAVSAMNPPPKSPIKNKQLAVCSSNMPRTTAVVTPASGSTSSVLSENYANFIDSLGPQWSQYPVHNAVPSKMSRGNIPNNNINVPVQNRYASAIILKPNHQENVPVGKYSERPTQAMAPQRPNNMPIPVHSQPRCQDSKQPYPQYYQSASSSRYQGYFPTSAHSVPNQFYSQKDNICHQLSNSMQSFYRGCWLPQHLAPPPPPPPPPPPAPPNPSIPTRNYHNVNQIKHRSNLNPPFYSSVSATQHSPSASCQNSVDTLHTKNSSIIGINNDGLVKKINIVALPDAKIVDTKKGVVTVETKIPQIITPLEESEIVTTKMEMLEELDKLSFADEDINDLRITCPDAITNETRKENTFEVAIMSNKPGKFETLKLTTNPKNNNMGTERVKGYSPPILPIPTYQKVLDRVVSNSQPQNAIPKVTVRPEDPRSNIRPETKPMRKRNSVKCCKRKLNIAWNIEEDSRKKDDTKKISLEEYKKRIFKNDCRSEYSNKKMCKEKYNNSLKRPDVEHKNRDNIDYSTETDLGYDSDSTVVL